MRAKPAATTDENIARQAGRPKGSGKKEQVTLRLDRDIVARFRAGGPGWQTRVNDTLRAVLDDPAMPIASTPWDREAQLETGVSLQERRDQVILNWLRQGNVNPLADWLVAGHRPRDRVLCRELGIMLHDDDEAADQLRPLLDKSGGEFGEWFRYRLEKKPRRGTIGRPPNPAKRVRDKQIAKRVESYVVEEGLTPRAAIKRMKAEIDATPGGVEIQTIRNATRSLQSPKFAPQRWPPDRGK